MSVMRDAKENLAKKMAARDEILSRDFVQPFFARITYGHATRNLRVSLQ